MGKGIGVGTSMTSGKFSVGGHDWDIEFYPDGKTEASKEYVSLYLKIVSPREVRETYEFKLPDPERKGKHGFHCISKSPRTFRQVTNHT
ncbi:hypothetical protein MKX03_020366, partial [Papaver bracteatum]